MAEATLLASIPTRPRSTPPHSGRAVAWAVSLALHVVAIGAWAMLGSEPTPVRLTDAPAAMSVALIQTTTAPAEPDTLPAPAPVSKPLLEPVTEPVVEPTPKPVVEVSERTEVVEIVETPPPAAEPANEPETAPAQALPAVAAPAPTVETAGQAHPDEVNLYVSRVRRLIDDRKRYPRQAERRGVEGTVLMRLQLTAGGLVGAIEMVDPAHKLLEKATRSAVERVGDFPPPPEGVSWIEVPVRYQLDS